MAKATIAGVEYEVRVTRDLGENWAVEVAQVPAVPRKWERFKPYPPRLLLKLRADSAEAAAKSALEQLKASRQIDDFTI